MLPTITNYGRYSSDNYGVHTLKVTVGPVTLWFSYKTCVAFQVDGHDQVVHTNIWGLTTGKHLNWLDKGQKERVNADKFQQLYNEQVLPVVGVGVELC